MSKYRDLLPEFDANVVRGILKSIPHGQGYVLGMTGYRILDELGLQTPVVFRLDDDVNCKDISLGMFPGDQVFIKAISSQILHKATSGAIRLVTKDLESIEKTVLDLKRNLSPFSIQEFLIEEFVPHRGGLGFELMMGLRWTPGLGPLLVLGPGGVRTETLNRAFRDKYGTRILSIDSVPGSESELLQFLGEDSRIWFDCSHQEMFSIADLLALLRKLAQFAEELMPEPVLELEINPLVSFECRPTALDVLVKLNPGGSHPAARRPIQSLDKLLHPSTIAIAGVSKSLNPGRIILTNTLDAGFDPSKMFLIKPGTTELEGIRCFESVSDLPRKVDLLIVAVSAEQSMGLVQETFETHKARSIILISGGFEETGDGSEAGQLLQEMIKRYDSDPDRPIINGPNCLGIRSLPGNLDSLFIPHGKLPLSQGDEIPMAFISQSGAMIAARLSSLPELNPKYLISVGNQSDLTVSDYLGFLGASEEIEFFAVYLEGFRPEDGSRFFRTAAKLFKAGKRVILYRAGRTRAGEAAARSHTASIGGDYRATIAFAEQSGIAVAESLDEFQDLIRLFAALRSKSITGLELALVSNAGFECVAFADHIQEANVAQFSALTAKTLRSILKRSNAAELIDIHNPLDITAMGDDQTFIDVLNTLLQDQQIDAVVVGCVPMSPSLETVPGPEGVETGFEPDSIVERLVEVHRKSPKPFIVVVDGGDLYQPFINQLRIKGVPVFQRMDYAVSIFEKYLMKRLGN